MCGLVASFNPLGVNTGLLVKALGMLKHRGPDNQGYETVSDGKVFLGHVRLKIIDLSDISNQPMFSPCGRYLLVYNGEIYNFKELMGEIGSDWKWRTRSDTEVLLAMYVLYGKKCLDRLSGMFAFVVYDTHQKTLFVARDRFGIKPVYFINENGVFSIASEIPPLLKLIKQVNEDSSMIRTYLETGMYNFDEHTFFDKVFSLKSGHYLDFDCSTGELGLTQWYNFLENVVDLSGYTYGDLVPEVEDRIYSAISSHLVSDVNVGLNVSGGVDSSMLVKQTLKELGAAHLFTQDYDGYSELPWVNKVSEGGVLHVSTLDSDSVEKVLHSEVISQAEPFGGVFVCGYNYLYRNASKNNVTVLLDGNGVDEIFLGYKKYHQLYINEAKTSSDKLSRTIEYETFWKEKPPASKFTNCLAIDGTIPIRADVISNELLTHDAYSVPNVDFFDSDVRNSAATDLLYTKIPRGLRFNDRVSMANSKELRVPFLDHKLAEFAFGIGNKFLLNKKGTKVIFRDILSKKVPASIAYSSKRSVQSPQREWLANQWKNKVTDIINSESFLDRGWVEPDKASKAFSKYIDGDNSNSFFIWQWLNLELWAREYIG